MGKILSFPLQHERHRLECRLPNLFLDKALSHQSHLLSASTVISRTSKKMRKEEIVKPDYYFKLLEPVQQVEHTANLFYRYLDCSPHIPAPIRSSRYSLLVLLHTVELQARELEVFLTEAHLHALQSTTPSLQDLRSRQDILGQIDLLVQSSRSIARKINGFVQLLDTQEEQLMHN